ncbi:MAG: hypothetical protein JWM27_141 [Gemmatimonadetes bacterium]|nr:hypothetical protein [Gemmatimonadota bacterium]
MATELTIESAASPDAVLAVIARDDRSWRDPVVPPALREAGLLRLHVAVHGPRFHVRCLCSRQAGDAPVLRGEVASRADGGTRVRARIEMPTAPKGMIVAFAVLGTALLAMGQWLGLALAGLAGTTALVDARRRRVDVARQPFAPYLAERLRAAVAAAADGNDGDAEAGAA